MPRPPLLYRGCCPTFGASNTPPWSRRGGRDINKNVAKPPLLERTGRLVQLPINRWIGRTAPSTPAAEASHLFLSGRSHPALTKAGSFLAATVRQQPLPRRGVARPEPLGNRPGKGGVAAPSNRKSRSLLSGADGREAQARQRAA